MIVYIMRKIAGIKYYWNAKEKQWEGLINNATPFTIQKAKDCQLLLPFETELINSSLVTI